MRNNNICKFIFSNITKGFLLTNFILESNTEVMSKRQTLRSHRIILVTSGQCVFYFNESSQKAVVGDVFLGFKGETFFAEAGIDSEYAYISFDGIRSEEIFNRFQINPSNRSFKNLQGIIPLWKESLSHANKLTIDLAAESILLYTFSQFICKTNSENSVVTKMVEITKNSFYDPHLSLTVLSNELGYNAQYLSHVFKKEMGMGYVEYLRNMRLKYAISLIDNGVDSVKNVALLSGFTDPLYFSTVFKKAMGITPKDYKNNLSQ